MFMNITIQEQPDSLNQTAAVRPAIRRAETAPDLLTSFWRKVCHKAWSFAVKQDAELLPANL